MAASIAFLFLVALGAAAPKGQEPAATGLVSVDFMALAADGQPIPDLRVDQVTLKVDGKARDIRSLQLVTLENARTAAADAPSASPLPPPFGTNALTDNGGPSRTVVVIVDTETLETNKERPMRDAVALLLTSFSARDRVALVNIPFGNVNVDFTQDRQKIASGLAQITGQAKAETGVEADCRTRKTLNALQGVIQDLGGGEGPTTVLFFSAGLKGIGQGAGLTGGGTVGTATNTGCIVDKDDFQNVGKAAAKARINLYIIPPDTNPISQPSLEGLQNLEGVTGGKRLAIQTASETALNRVARETAAYYVATFAPEANELNGLTHSVDLKPSRPGVTIRNRPSVVIEKAGLAAASAKVTAREMLKETKVRRELGLRVAGYTSRNQGDANMKIIALAEPVDPAAILSTMSLGLFDSGGHLVAQWNSLPVNLAPYPVAAALVAPAGIYRLRAAATDTFGRVGSVDYEVNANLITAGSLKLSSVVMGLSRNSQFLPRMQFGLESSAIAELQIYGQLTKEDGAWLELCDTLNGQGFLATRLVIEPTSEPDRFTAKGTIPVGLLPAGDFVARAIVQKKGEPEARVVQTIRKVVR